MPNSQEKCPYVYLVDFVGYKCDALSCIGFVPSEAVRVVGSSDKLPQYMCGLGLENNLGNQEQCLSEMRIREAFGRIGEV